MNALVRWGLVVCWMVLIFVLSRESADGSSARSDVLVGLLQSIGFTGAEETLIVVVRKSAHLLAYAVLGGLVVWALAAKRQVAVGLLATAVAISFLYAVSDELHQVYVPGRSGEVRDVAVDTAGASLGVGAMGWVLRKRLQREL